ncbi:hypothetical protein CCUS01_06573 [Colletotrichum cuscutae]|uniref:Uncharacterized protein n=1 Tax=Colletotrichum cuscutae TaxID=1209917 RepID=A0AAI9V7H4_9PEZI|nr:hypothetical protein CCUS01_06573 [Colletotrichum cuscutae]
MRQIKSLASTSQELVHECERHTQQRCSNFEWRDFRDAQYSPGRNTVILLVDMREAVGCAVYIHNERDGFVDMVGIENKGHVVLVPWEQGLKIVCYGQCTVAEIIALEASTT